MIRLGPRVWLGAALLVLLALVATAFVGGWAGGKDIEETCAAAGQSVDQRYRAEHWREPGRLFPMHNRCNADHDLVPGWVNPALVILTVTFVGCLVAAAAGRLMGGSRASRASDRMVG
jgi:hypothetical protein